MCIRDRIEGVPELTGSEHQVIPDRIEAGSYLIAAAMTGGELTLENVIADHLKPVIAKLEEAGCLIVEGDNSLWIKAGPRLEATDIKTLPYPGFPTDMQAQYMTLMTKASGASVITETVFENRFMHVQELVRMGADIRLSGHTAIIRGVQRLAGAPVMASDLRASASLVLAGLAAKGTTTVQLSLIHI